MQNYTLPMVVVTTIENEVFIVGTPRWVVTAINSIYKEYRTILIFSLKYFQGLWRDVDLLAYLKGTTYTHNLRLWNYRIILCFQLVRSTGDSGGPSLFFIWKRFLFQFQEIRKINPYKIRRFVSLFRWKVQQQLKVV